MNELTILRVPLALLNHRRHVLRLGADPVPVDAPSLTVLTKHMLRAMYSERGGVGLAAPMLGIAARVVVLDVDGRVDVMANPRIVESTGPFESAVEANLCIPYVWAPVSRRLGLTVEYDDLRGDRRHIRVDGWRARVIAHELELLEGDFYLDAVDEIEHAAPLDPTLSTDPANPEMIDNMPALSVVTLPVDLLDVPGSILRRRADPVDLEQDGGDQLRWLVREMLVLQHHLEGVGLAAPQVGLSLRLAVVDSGQNPPVILLNPELLDRSDETEEGTEGCLSLPWLAGPVTRSASVKVRTHDLNGEPHIIEASGYLARVVQHEMDHLDGVLYTDHLHDLSQLNHIDPETLADRAMEKLVRADDVEPLKT